MKRVIAVSDSHEMTDKLREVLCHAFKRGPVDGLCFLGDGLYDFEAVSREFLKDQPNLQTWAVCGNNDWSASVPHVQTFSMGGVKFFMCHGHQYRVKQGLGMLEMAAVEAEARVALFGHTHLGYLASEYGCTFINPGAVCAYGDDVSRYADIRIAEDGGIRADLITQRAFY